MSSSPSKKRITCYYWALGNRCKFPADECKYVHGHTDAVAHPPKALSRALMGQKQIQEDLISLSSKKDDSQNDEKESIIDDQPGSRLISSSPESPETPIARELRAVIAKGKDYEFVKNLLERESSSTTKESLGSTTFGKTAMSDAVNYGRTDLLRLMIKHGSDPNARDNRSGVPVLALAIFQNNASAAVAVTILLELGADPFVIPKDMWDDQVHLESHLISQEDMSKIQWCDDRHRTLLEKCFNLTIKYALREAAKKSNVTVGGQKVNSLVHVEYSNHLLIGQELALRRTNDFLECYLLCGRKEPLVITLIAPPGHGTTELARRIGNIKCLPINASAAAYEEVVAGTRAPSNRSSTDPSHANVFCVNNPGKADLQHIFSALESLNKREGEKGTIDSPSDVVIITITKEYTCGFYDILKRVKNGIEGPESWDMCESLVRQDLVETFGPSIASRIDCIVPFGPFSKTETTLLTHKFILDAAAGLTNSCPLIPNLNFGKHLSFTVDADTKVCEYIGESSYNINHGARSIAKAVFRQVKLSMVQEYKKAYPSPMNSADRRLSVHRPLNFVIRLKPDKSVSVKLK